MKNRVISEEITRFLLNIVEFLRFTLCERPLTAQGSPC